jgi:hypothetical protein
MCSYVPNYLLLDFLSVWVDRKNIRFLLFTHSSRFYSDTSVAWIDTFDSDSRQRCAKFLLFV